jgi:hypothetical protein
MSAPNHRTLEEIGVDLSNALRNRTMDMLSAGRFLNEAREVADHGTWLPFLKLHRIDERSARRYMTGAAWCDAKSGNSPDSAFYLFGQITPQAIYALASGKYADDVVEQVISAAQYRHIGIKDVQSIARVGEKAAILREIKAAQEAEMAERLARAKAAGCDTIEEYDATVVLGLAEDKHDAEDGVEDDAGAEDGAEDDAGAEDDVADAAPTNVIPLAPKKTNAPDEDIPSEEEADESWQNDLYDQACLLLERMADKTRQRFFAHILIDSGAPNDEMACSIIENLGRDKAALLIQALKLNLAADTTKVDQTKH